MTRTLTALCTASALAFAAPAWASTGGTHAGHTAFGHPGSAKDVVRTIRIEAAEYSFAPAAVSVKSGETIKFVVANTGRLKHELTIGDAAEQEAHRKSMSEMEHMKHDEGAHEMPPNAVHVAPGKAAELIWTFTKSGTLAIACNYPGHSDLGMQGTLEVK